MNKTLSTFLLAVSPMLVFAGGNLGGHDMGSMTSHIAGMHQEEHNSDAGRAGDPSKVSRTIEVIMDDSMRFTPSQISVKTGETIRFFVKNAGKVPHEMVIGTASELKEHAEMMRQMPGMKHADSNTITLAPGKRGGIVWQFDKTGLVEFACLIPGHTEAGMKGTISVK